MPYPSAYQVEIATQVQLARWTWLLPDPVNAQQIETRAAIKARFQGWTPKIYNSVDWTNRIN